jgi:hypothetical protein
MRGSLLGRVPSETRSCWFEVLVGRVIKGMERTVQALAAHGVLKRCSDIVASPGTMLAPALSS